MIYNREVQKAIQKYQEKENDARNTMIEYQQKKSDLDNLFEKEKAENEKMLQYQLQQIEEQQKDINATWDNIQSERQSIETERKRNAETRLTLEAYEVRVGKDGLDLERQKDLFNRDKKAYLESTDFQTKFNDIENRKTELREWETRLKLEQQSLDAYRLKLGRLGIELEDKRHP